MTIEIGDKVQYNGDELMFIKGMEGIVISTNSIAKTPSGDLQGYRIEVEELSLRCLVQLEDLTKLN
jgi:hypothetical protein